MPKIVVKQMNMKRKILTTIPHKWKPEEGDVADPVSMCSQVQPLWESMRLNKKFQTSTTTMEIHRKAIDQQNLEKQLFHI